MSEENNEVKSEQIEEQKPESQEGAENTTQAEENSAGTAEGGTDADTAAPEQENSNA